MSDDIDKWIALGRKAMSCKGFEWRPGMVHFNGMVSRDEWFYGATPADALPDLRDPGTVGHCLAMMRAALLAAEAFVSPDDDGWAVWDAEACGYQHASGHATEAEAIIAAWKAAPCD